MNNFQTAAQKHGSTFEAGQAMSEIALLLPLFVILAGGVISVTYMCWQGIRVQQAANLAARIQGQERVSGGLSQQTILQDNGLDAAVESVPDDASIQQLGNDPNALGGFKAPPTSGVYAKYYNAVNNMFGPGERKNLFVPPPILQGINSDKVEVVRVLNPPKILDFKLKPITLKATAYGGEDPHMYGLPRWGRSDSNNNQFYTTAIENPGSN